jgi:hypothetical protein
MAASKERVFSAVLGSYTQLTLNLLTSTIVAPPSNASKWQMGFNSAFNPLNAELNPICHLLALLAHPILHVSSIRVKGLKHFSLLYLAATHS